MCDMTRLCYLLIVVTGMLLGGCTKPRFILEFDLPADIYAGYNIQYYASSSTQSKWYETVAMVQQGKGKMELPLGNPAVVELQAGPKTIYLYAERGDKFKISGKSDDIFTWSVEGNDISHDWSVWRNANAAALAAGNSKEINAAVGEYVKKNPSDPLSALLLLFDYNRKENNEGFLKLWKLLKGEAAMEKWITLSGRTDLLDNHPVMVADKKKKHTLILKSFGNGADTIVTGKVPVAILFRRNGDMNKKEMLDSLRALRKSHPDSAKYIIADVCFDPDSLSWAAPLASDSLQKIIRAWNPLAEADSAIRALGVEKTPTLLIFPALARPKKKK